MDIVYKIRHNKTGLFKNSGGHWGEPAAYRWSKKGKTWSSLGALKLHMHLCVACATGKDVYKAYVAKYPEHEIISYTRTLEPCQKS